MISEIQQSSIKNKPKISLTEAKIESKPIEKKEKVNEKSNVLSNLENIFEKNIPIIKEQEEETQKDNLVDKEEKKSIMRFNSFK